MNARDHPHRRFVASLFGTLKLMQMYGSLHDATSDAVNNLCDAVREAAGGLDEVVVSLRGTRLKINDRSMRASECGNLALSTIAEEWSRRAIAAIHIRADIGPAELAAFVRTFLEVGPHESDPCEMLAMSLSRQGIKAITIERRNEAEVDPVLREERREATMNTYLRGLKAFKEVLRKEGHPDRIQVRRARRAVQGLVDRFVEDEAAMLTLAQIRGHDIKLFHHCMNVSLYALAIGQRIRMSRRQLGELGLAALFHDLGRTVATPALPGESESQCRRRATQQVPSRGARILLAESANHQGMLKAAIAAYEQHSPFDQSGLPGVGHELHLFSRIIAIADCYDALTCRRTPEEPAHSTYDAFRLMQARSGTVFDPLLLKVFMNALGIYPVGSLVMLTTGEVAIVVAGPDDPRAIEQPKVRIIEQARGRLEPDTEIDLAEQDTEGRPLRSIRATLAAHEVFASIGDLVAAV